MRSKLLRKLIGGLSFTTALFVFQACYGTPQDFGSDLYVEGIVKSKKTGAPIKGIKVSVENFPQYEFTAEDGSFSLYTEITPLCKIMFEDADSDQNGAFLDKDTILTNPYGEIHLDILLEDK